MTGQPDDGPDLESARNAAALLIALHHNDGLTVDLILGTCNLRRMLSWCLVYADKWMQSNGIDPVTFARSVIAATLASEAGQ